MLEKKKSLNNTSSHLKNQENEEQNEIKASRRQDIIKSRTEINEIKNKTIEKITETQLVL